MIERTEIMNAESVKKIIEQIDVRFFSSPIMSIELSKYSIPFYNKRKRKKQVIFSGDYCSTASLKTIL